MERDLVSHLGEAQSRSARALDVATGSDEEVVVGRGDREVVAAAGVGGLRPVKVRTRRMSAVAVERRLGAMGDLRL